MDSYDSQRDNRSGLRPPSRYPLPSAGGLAELSASEHNSRQSNMAPPAIPMKHRPQNLPEPVAKQRKTQAESAGEYPRKQYTVLPSSSIRHVNPAVKPIAQAAPRPMLSASSMRMPSSYPPKTSSNGSYPSKTSSNGVPRYGHQRSQSAMAQYGRSQSQTTARPGTSNGARPVSSIAQANQSTTTAPSGTEPISLTSNVFALPRRKNRVTRVVSEQSHGTSRSSSGCSHTTSVPVVGRLSRSNSVAQVNRMNGRISSLSSAFKELVLREGTPELEEDQSLSQSETNGAAQLKTPRHSQMSQIPISTPKKNLETSVVKFQPPPTLPKPRTQSSKKSPRRQLFLNKESNVLAPIAWDAAGAVEKRLESMQNIFENMKSQMEGTTFESKGMKDIIEMLKSRVVELEAERNRLTMQMDNFREKLSEAKEQTARVSFAAEEARRNHEIDVDELERKQRYEVEDLKNRHDKEIDRLKRDAASIQEDIRRETRDELDRLIRSHKDALEELESRLRGEIEKERRLRLQEVEEITTQRDAQLRTVATDIGQKEREAAIVREELERKAADIEHERTLRQNIESKLSEAAANALSLEAANSAMKAKIDFLASDNQAQSQAFADLHKKMQDAIEAAAVANEKLRAEETLRRKLHNQVQELKGNIRVFCRVRPLNGDEKEAPAKINFPDQSDESKEIVVQGPETKSALGNVTVAKNAFSFDRVFDPSSVNADVFEEISQLVQSALDGYNVCIFCYGQTGAGKTHTMSSPDGMIPRAVGQIYETAKNLEEKGWKYKMVGSFVEVYNENINDLLGKAEDLDKKNYKIIHENNKTTITDTETVELDSPERVHEVLKRADGNRSVAATKANLRSSRSHSVFILSLVGENSITGEKSEGTLNLVDLAGSERLAHSQAEGQRLKETQSINKSLSCLGDVIGALGKGESAHIPYRNSKLTYLLQNSLGGNSKTLMFVMVSPLQAHLKETLTSLQFATKVHNTHIGTAKQKKGH